MATIDRTKVQVDPETAEAARRRGLANNGQVDKRTIWIAALVILGLTGFGIIGVALLASSDTGGPRQDTQGQIAEDGGDKPHIIARPNSGTAPKNDGDRGGWEQLALFGLLVVSMGGIGFAIFRSRGRAQAGRQAWAAVAATGRDGAVSESGVRLP